MREGCEGSIVCRNCVHMKTRHQRVVLPRNHDDLSSDRPTDKIRGLVSSLSAALLDQL